MNKLRKKLDKYKDIALSDVDMINLMDGKARIVLYPDLSKFSSLEELLHPYGVTFILYLWHVNPTFGHWVVLIDGPEFIEYFDPYGLPPDAWLDELEEPFKTESGQGKPLLTKLLVDYDGPKELTYNEFQFQALNKGTQDCGRWAALRGLLREISLKEFKKLFFGMYSDDLATFLTTPNGDLL